MDLQIPNQCDTGTEIDKKINGGDQKTQEAGSMFECVQIYMHQGFKYNKSIILNQWINTYFINSPEY